MTAIGTNMSTPPPQEPDHPILRATGKYEIIRIAWNEKSADEEAWLDLSLQYGDEIHELRFFSPRKIILRGNFPMQGGGLYIRDIRSRGWDSVGVEVGSDEQDESLHFYARSVEKIK